MRDPQLREGAATAPRTTLGTRASGGMKAAASAQPPGPACAMKGRRRLGRRERRV